MCYVKPNLTVGQLKELLRDVPDELQVGVHLPPDDADTCNSDRSPGDMAHIVRAYHGTGSSISNPEFMLVAGDTYSY